MTLARLNSSNPKLKITVNKMNVTLPNLCTVNGEIEVDSYSIQNGDDVEVLDFLKVSQVLELLDMELKDNEVVFVNNEEADMNTKVYARFNLEIKKKKELTYADLPEDNEYLSGEEDDGTGFRLLLGILFALCIVAFMALAWMMIKTLI